MEKPRNGNSLVRPGKSYFEEKAAGDDFAQINALPPKLQQQLLDGTPMEFRAALRQLRRMEFERKGPVLGLAALELIRGERVRRGSDQSQKPPGEHG